jgi:hypothetical protein
MHAFRYPLMIDAKELGHLGRGYGMYYAFMKDINMVLMILTIFVSVIIVSMTVVYLNSGNYQFTSIDSFIQAITIRTLLVKVESEEQKTYAVSIFVACNVAGIFYLLVHSVFQRRKLVKMKHDLDKNRDTPSSFALLVRHARIHDDFGKEEFRLPMDKWQIQKYLIDECLYSKQQQDSYER